MALRQVGGATLGRKGHLPNISRNLGRLVRNQIQAILHPGFGGELKPQIQMVEDFEAARNPLDPANVRRMLRHLLAGKSLHSIDGTAAKVTGIPRAADAPRPTERP